MSKLQKMNQRLQRYSNKVDGGLYYIQWWDVTMYI